jgi:hypothetical protein
MAKGNNVVEFTLRAKDHVSRVLTSIGGSISSFTKSLLNQGANIKAWGDMLAGAFQGTFGRLWGSIREAFKFETLEGQFRTLLGSVDAAKERMQMLARVAEETPFDMEGVVKASRILTVMSKDALGTEWALKLVGDTAAAVGANVDELAMWIGRAYAMIQAGKPFGEAAMRLTELGALTPEVRQKMEDLQASGASNAEVWEALVAHLETFGGAMKDLSQTGDGLVSTLEDDWAAAVREFGSAFMASAKDSIGFLINKLKELQASGAITEWAEKAMKALEPLRNLIVGILGDDNSRAQAFSAAWDYLREVFKYGGTVITAAADYAVAKLADVGTIMRDSIAAAVATSLENMRYTLKELWHDINLDNISWGSRGARMQRKQEHADRLAGIENAVGEAHAARMGKAGEAFAAALEAAGDRLAEASKRMTDAVADAAEEGRKAVVLGNTGAVAETAEDARKRLAAEKKKAADAMDAATNSMQPKLSYKDELERRNAALRARTFTEMHAESIRRGFERETSDLDSRITDAKAYRDERLKRAMDNNYAKEQEKAERDQQKERDKYNKRARNLLQRQGKRILSEGFDLNKLSKRDRRLAEAMRAEKQVEKLERIREQAYEASIDTAKNTKAMLDVTKQLLALK